MNWQEIKNQFINSVPKVNYLMLIGFTPDQDELNGATSLLPVKDEKILFLCRSNRKDSRVSNDSFPGGSPVQLHHRRYRKSWDSSGIIHTSVDSSGANPVRGNHMEQDQKTKPGQGTHIHVHRMNQDICRQNPLQTSLSIAFSFYDLHLALILVHWISRSSI